MSTGHHDGHLVAVEARLGYAFAHRERLREALTHPSWRHEHPEDADNARLEFLGDAFLGFVVASLLVGDDPNADEGLLTRRRIAHVRNDRLPILARRLGLDAPGVLRLGVGEERNHLGEPRRLADATEAVIGALVEDAGAERARHVLARLVGSLRAE